MGIFDGILSTVAGPLISGFLGYKGQEEANDTSQQIAAQNTAFNAEEAQKARIFNQAEASTQRDWLRDMSNTSYRRAVEDLKQAGLNPMLAYSQGGASTPSGASASGPAAQASALPTIGNKNLAGISSAAASVALQQQQAQIDQTRAQTENIRTQTESERMKQPGHLLSGEIATAQARKLREEIANIIEHTQVNRQTAIRINSEVHNLIKQGKNIDETFHLIQAQIKRELSGTDLNRATERLNRLRGDLEQLDIKGEAGARSKYYETIGPTGYGAERVVDKLGGLVNSAAQAKRAFRGETTTTETARETNRGWENSYTTTRRR